MHKIIEDGLTTYGYVVHNSSAAESSHLHSWTIGSGSAFTNPHWQQYPAVSYSVHVCLAVIVMVILFAAVTGNSIMIYLYCKFKSLRSPTNLLLANLAVGNLGLAITGFPLFIIASFQGHWPFGKAGCQYYGAAGATFGLMSINNMAVIAIDRYLAISRELKITFKQSYVFIIIVWIYSILWALPPLMGWSEYSLEGFQTTCSYDFFTTDNYARYFLVTVLIGDYVLPLTLISGCYAAILIKFILHKKEFEAVLSGKEISQRKSTKSYFSHSYRTGEIGTRGQVAKKPRLRKTEYKLVRTVAIVVIAYLLSWTPYATIAMIGQYGNPKLVTPYVSMISILFAKLSTVFNPLIYGISHPKFKSACRKAFPVLFFKLIKAERTACGYVIEKWKNESLERSNAIKLKSTESERTGVGSNSYYEEFLPLTIIEDSRSILHKKKKRNL